MELIRPGDLEHVVRHFIDPTAGHDAADLGLLGERDDIGLDPQLLVGPRGSCGTDAGLHLVHDEQRIMGVHQLEHCLQELRPHVVVTALALDWLGNEGCNVVGVVGEGSFGLLQSVFFGDDHLVEMISERMSNRGHVDPAAS